MKRLSIASFATVLVTACGAAAPEPTEPTEATATEQPQATQAELRRRLIAAMTSCEARARCCTGAEQTAEECEAEMAPLREMFEGLIEGSQHLASGAATFDERAITSLEDDMQACRPWLGGDAFLNSVITGSITEGGSCGDGNAFDAASCRDDLICDLTQPAGVCAQQTAENFIAQPSSTDVYCPRP